MMYQITRFVLPLGMLITPGIASAEIIPGEMVLPESAANPKPSAKSNEAKWYLKTKDDHQTSTALSEKYMPQVDALRTEAPLLGYVDISTTNQFTRYEGQASSIFDRTIRDTNAVDPESYILKARTRW
jgi:hypothetical protein